MVYKLTLLSDEVDDFVREIHIDPEATFLELNNAILSSVHYETNHITTFFTCNDDWEKEQEVTLIEMDAGSEYDNLVMESTKLEELLFDENQKLLFVFDMMLERAFFIELTEIIPGKNVSETQCVLSEGDAPQQIMSEDDLFTESKLVVDENFYGDEDYDLDELDEEGFGDMNFDDSSLFSDDANF